MAKRCAPPPEGSSLSALVEVNYAAVMIISITLMPLPQIFESARSVNPDMAIALLFAFYDFQSIKALRRFSLDSGAGCAYLLKHTVDTADQLVKVVNAVAEGRVIIDPMVMEGLVREDNEQTRLLSELTPREFEVLSWMAKGYRNDTIADVRGCDVRTVERHIKQDLRQARE